MNLPDPLELLMLPEPELREALRGLVDAMVRGDAERHKRLCGLIDQVVVNRTRLRSAVGDLTRDFWAVLRAAEGIPQVQKWKKLLGELGPSEKKDTHPLR